MYTDGTRDFASALLPLRSVIRAPVLQGQHEAKWNRSRFFLAWAQVWRRLYREDNLISRLTTDPHSPSQYRTNGVVRNLDAWYEAFGVTEDDDLYLPPEERVSIW